MSKRCIRFYVSGRVQGVFYRANTKKEAIRLGLTGWTRNTSDGRVEVFACGEEEPLRIFQRWLWKGSLASKVTDVAVQEMPWEDHMGFEVLK